MELISMQLLLKGIGIALKIPQFISTFKTSVEVEVELNKTFDKALKTWSPNSAIREKKRLGLKQKIEGFSDPKKMSELLTDDEIISFVKVYEKHLSEHSAAYNYISGIKQSANFEDVFSKLESIDDKTNHVIQKFTEYLENNLPSKNASLEEEWKRQIIAYKESISNFRPKTALDLLVKMEESFEFNEIKPSKYLLSMINFQKAQCYGMLGLSDELHESNINAYRYDKTLIHVIEKACYSYSKFDKDKARELIVKLKLEDEFNPIAWGVEVLISDNFDLTLSEIPPLVLGNIDFKRVVYFNLYEFENAFELIEKYGLYPEVKHFEKFPTVSFDNFKNWLFLIETQLTFFIRNLVINKPIDVDIRTGSLVRLNKFLEHFLEQMSHTEVAYNKNGLEFYYWFTEFSLQNKNEFVYNMHIAYLKINEVDRTISLLMANSFYGIKDIDNAILTINSQPIKDIDLLNLKAKCELTKEYYNEYVQTIRELFLLINHIDFHNAELIISAIHSLSLIQKIDELDRIFFLDSKNYESDFLKNYIKCIIDFEKGDLTSDQFVFLQSIEDVLISKGSTILFYIPFIYYESEKYEIAVELFQKYASEDFESRDLYYLILSLERSRGNHTKLLKLLKKWRLDFSFEESLLRIEADLNWQLPDWKLCLEISDYYLENRKEDESFLTLKLVSLTELKPSDYLDKIEDLISILKDYDFKNYHNHRTVSSLLIENGFYVVGLDLNYNAAFKSNNIQAKMDFFFSTMKLPTGIIKEFDLVEYDCYVAYLLEGVKKFLKIQKGNILAEKLVGCKVGDTIQMQRPYTETYESIQVVRIMDKYLYLHDLILDEVNSDPYSGLPLQSFTFKDNSPEGMTSELISRFGATGAVMKDAQDSAFKEYYNYKLTFSELMIQVYSSNYIGGYFALIGTKDGIMQLSKTMYPVIEDLNQKEFVIDLSSLIFLHRISEEFKVDFKKKFLITTGNVEFIKNLLKGELAGPKEKMRLGITLNEVRPYLQTETATNSNIEYINKLLIWIKNNCVETIVKSKLDIVRKFKNSFRNETFDSIIIENLALVLESENNILITDDSLYLKVLPLSSKRTTSLEIFVKSIVGEQSECLQLFIDHKYIGYTIDSQTIFREFQLKLKSKPNKYDHCVNNLALNLLPGIETIKTGVDFLKQVAINSHLTDLQFQQEATKVLFYLLNGQIEKRVFDLTFNTIQEEFKILGLKLNLILEAYLQAVTIINSSKRS